ncbi:hypothetical protein B6N60_00218 [Richelia sinica FACHB-800]|uniref:Uncharacterized protein n=1 Tax=Richelia sinica FACHB-800 TaxID=1357546 RepID=A0A975T500_9NOST|nr:hypothetical protein B6N60_00218 [Richelia sinica FACHB-800]
MTKKVVQELQELQKIGFLGKNSSALGFYPTSHFW